MKLMARLEGTKVVLDLGGGATKILSDDGKTLTVAGLDGKTLWQGDYSWTGWKKEAPGPSPGIDMSNQVQVATLLDFHNSDGWYGFEAGSQYGMNQGAGAWFLIDPSALGVTGQFFSFSATSFHQQAPALSIWGYEIDASNHLVGDKFPVGGDADWYGFKRIPYPTGHRFLVQVTASYDTGIACMWQLSN